MFGQFVAHIKALVLQGLPTTTTLVVGLATRLRISPWVLKMAAFACNRSPLSIPGDLGLDPTRMAKSTSLKPSLASEVLIIYSTSGYAQSYISMQTPLRAFSA